MTSSSKQYLPPRAVDAGRWPDIAVAAGSPVRAAVARVLFTRAVADDLAPLTFLDLNTGLIDRELARVAASRRSGPAAENILRDLGAVAHRIG